MNSLVKRTPLYSMEKYGRPDIFIKLECLQFSGSFKSRGVISFLENNDFQDGVVAYTTGNHGIAVSAIARQQGVRAVIVSSLLLTDYKKSIMESNGAEVRLIDNHFLHDGDKFARDLAEKLHYTFIPLYGDEALLKGYSGVADEVCDKMNEPFTFFLPVGTGSCFLANARRVKEINPLNLAICVEPELYQRLNNPNGQDLPSQSIADCLSIPAIPDFNKLLFNYMDGRICVSDLEMEEAEKIIYDKFKIITEPGAAITLAAAIKTPNSTQTKVALISGGNISPEKFNQYTSDLNWVIRT